MKKKFLFMLPCIAAVAFATFVGTKTLRSNASESNSLLMANVEALSEDTEPKPQPQKCTKAREGAMGSCYRDKTITLPDGRVVPYQEFAGTYVNSVEEYEVYPGSPIICQHELVHDCPSGTHK